MIEHLVNAFIIDYLKIIGLEEHFATPELIDAWHALEPQWQDVALVHSSDDELTTRLLEVDAERIAGRHRSRRRCRVDDDARTAELGSGGCGGVAGGLQRQTRGCRAPATRSPAGVRNAGHPRSERGGSRTRQSRHRTRVQRRHAVRANA